jgi:hypothetical protein
MTIEVRQLTIRSSVGTEPAAAPRGNDPRAAQALLQRQLREQLLAECKRWLEQRLQGERER